MRGAHDSFVSLSYRGPAENNVQVPVRFANPVVS
jgi:hypothetical protein